MRLVVDSSVLVGQCLRRLGRLLLGSPALELLIAEHTYQEALHELPKRMEVVRRRAGLTGSEASALLLEVVSGLDVAQLVPADFYLDLQEEAKARLVDPSDWPTLALSLALDCGVWTEDRDFFGTGVATWTSMNVRRVVGL